MKEKILKIYNNYIIKNPSLRNKNVILMLEGLGTYKGKATKNITLHPKGRMGAIFAVITKDGELFYTTCASTLPDIPMGIGKYNTGTPTPTLKAGIYKVYSTLHHGKYPAMEVGLGNEGVPVVRIKGNPRSSGINVHSRPYDDYKNIACSAGCPTILESEFLRMLEILGVTKNGHFKGSGRFIANLIIDRSKIDEGLVKLYKDTYGKAFFDVFNINIPTDIHKHWAKNNIIEAIENGLMNGYPDGIFKPDQLVTRAELATVVVNLLRKVGK
ncbi:hypothetical protein AN1V17_11930 [Vallitalea sediminicola]